MKKYWITAAVVALLAAVGTGAFLVGSRHGEQHSHSRHRPGIDLQGRPVIDLGLAIETATKLVPGEVLKVELENEDDRYIYEVKVLAQNGRVLEIKLDAKDGSLIEIEDD